MFLNGLTKSKIFHLAKHLRNGTILEVNNHCNNRHMGLIKVMKSRRMEGAERVEIMGKVHTILIGNHEGKYHFEEMVLGSVILKCLLKRQRVRICIGFTG